MKNASPVLPVLLPMQNYAVPRVNWRPPLSKEDLFAMSAFPGFVEFEDAPYTPPTEMLVMKAVKASPEAICAVCCEKVVDTILLPCDHSVVCWSCYTGMKESGPVNCGHCLRPVQDIVHD
jgi:hypothetical protein